MDEQEERVIASMKSIIKTLIGDINGIDETNKINDSNGSLNFQLLKDIDSFNSKLDDVTRILKKQNLGDKSKKVEILKQISNSKLPRMTNKNILEGSISSKIEVLKFIFKILENYNSDN